MDSVKHFILGGSGVAGVELASTIDLPNSPDLSEVLKIVVQLVIGVATLIGLFKKKTPST